MRSKPNPEEHHPKGEGGASKSNVVAEDWRPTCLYLYYLIPENKNHATIKVYVSEANHRLDDSNINDFILYTLGLIRQGALRPLGLAFRDLKWIRVSYIALIADHAGFALSLNGIKFKRYLAHAAYTFKYPTDIAGLQNPLTGVRFLNDMMFSNGRRLGNNDKETFKVDLKFDSRFPFEAEGPRTHNDSGTNLGPPQPPPP